MLRMKTGLAVAASLLGMLWSRDVQAQGFFINQQSVRGLGRADAGNVAAANDPGTVFFNPAGMTELWRADESSIRWKAAVSVHTIIPRATLNNDGSTAATPGTLGTPLPIAATNASNPTDPTPVPNGYLAYRGKSDRWYLGVGLNLPFGLSEEYSADWWGRYDSVKAKLTTKNFASTLAFRLNEKISIGGGIDFQSADSELSSAIPNPLIPGGPSAATDARISITGDDLAVGFNAGILLKPQDKLRIGFHYRSGMNYELEGKATTSGFTGPLASLNSETDARAELQLPKIVAAGFAYEATDALTIYGDYSWFGWNVFDVTRIEFSNGSPDAVRNPNFKNGHGAAAGVDYDWSEKFSVRGGFKLDRSPTVDGSRDTTFADDNRYWLAGGMTYLFSKHVALDIAVTHVLVDETTVDVTRSFFEASPVASSAQVKGTVDSVVNTIAGGVRFSF